MGKISWVNIKSALVYGVLTAIVFAILAMAGYVLQIGDIFGIDWKALVNTGVIAFITGIVMGVSIIKNLLTTDDGKFMDTVKVIPPTE